MNHLELALSQIGVKELVGQKHNPVILNYAKEIGHAWVATDETPWCSIFLNWVAMKSGLEYSNKLNAKSWLEVGEKIDQPKLGDVVIFYRENPKSWKGHVALYISETKTHTYVLGGNQRNSVCIMAYPKFKIIGYRRLRKL